MTDESLERRLAAAFTAWARSNVPDDAVPPPMRLPDHGSPVDPALARPSGRARWPAPLAAAAAVLVAVAVVLGTASGASTSGSTQNASAPSAGVSHPSVAPSTRADQVTVSSAVLADGSVVGVGMPISILLGRRITDARGFASATTVTVNGRPAQGAWFFHRTARNTTHPIEADYRMRTFWPGHALIRMSLPVKGLSAGTGEVFANDLTLDFRTGHATVATVDSTRHTMTVVSDGKTWAVFPVSLGAATTPTTRGTKVIMEKGRSICMSGPGYHECAVKDTQRLTYDGEYLHSAPWNCTGKPGCTGPQNNIGRANTSNGCTNLTPVDASKLYAFLRTGDVVRYPNADGPLMRLGDGYGAWNVPWRQWLTGGLYRTG